jgi:hypothetical protein
MLAILAAVMLAAAAPNDTVFTSDGGRVIGTVIEEGPQGISVQLPDGTTRRLARGEVTRIEYADGSVSTPSRPAPPPPAYRAPPQQPPPAYRPPPAPPPPAYRPPPPQYAYPPSQPPPPAYAGPHKRPLVPFYGSLGLGGSFVSGDAAAGVPMEDVFGSQLGIWLDSGVRLTPHLGLGLYLDWGVGDAAGAWGAYCDTLPGDCTAATGRFGILMRHTFQPYASSTPWLGIGTGFEWGNLSVDYDYGGNEEIFSYEGWEMVRLMGGVDLRANPVFGFGLYAGVSFGRYTSYDEPAYGSYDIDGERTHTTVEAGLRFTLFP